MRLYYTDNSNYIETDEPISGKYLTPTVSSYPFGFIVHDVVGKDKLRTAADRCEYLLTKLADPSLFQSILDNYRNTNPEFFL